jgi:RimJ/RimL family protein N-acetyltransferase
MIIRECNNHDAEKFLQMLQQLDKETKFMLFEPGERKTTVEQMQKSIESIVKSNSLQLVVEDKDKIVGFLLARRGTLQRNKLCAYIVIGILEKYRGRKIGQRLFMKMEEWAKISDIHRLELTVMTHNKAAIKLYEKMGFKKEGIKEKSLVVDGKFVDEFYMAKII